MHRLIFAAFFVVSVTCGNRTDAENTDKSQLCIVLSGLAESLMRARQNGVPMTQAMDVAQKSDPEIRTLITKLVIAAYDVPQYSTPKNQQREILDFQNQVALECYKSLN